MAVRPFITAPEDYVPALDIVGEHVTVLASGEATDGYEIFLQRGPEGSGPPPHSHPWDESFFRRDVPSPGYVVVWEHDPRPPRQHRTEGEGGVWGRV